MVRRVLIVYMVGALALSSLCFAQDGPTAQVKATVDKVLDILKDPALKGPEAEAARTKQLRDAIFARFDFSEMAKRSLGIHWRKRTPKERKEFVAVFSDLLELSYRKKIERYTDEEILYTKEKVKGKFGVVNTQILNERENVDIPIDYKVIHTDGEWKVYDVVIDGISLVSNYRSQFNRIIQRSSYKDLVKKMRVKQETELEEASSSEKQ
ncbi:MAG: phospholipid-binding protein MlaC [Candidatus Methylomirabilales bacterium]